MSLFLDPYEVTENVANICKAELVKSIEDALINESLERRTILFTDDIKRNIHELEMLIEKRLPIVIVNFSGNQEILKIKDLGFILFMPSSNQEIVDSIIQAFKTCEDSKVLLPAVINVDKLNIVEEVVIPSDKSLSGYLQNPKLTHANTDYKSSVDQIHLAMENVKDVIEENSEKWRKKFNRFFGFVDEYESNEKNIIISAGYDAMTIKSVVAELNSDEKQYGLIRINIANPMQLHEFSEKLKNKNVFVVDKAVSPGKGGVLFSEISKICPDAKSFIATRDIKKGDVEEIFKSETEERVWID